MSDGISTARILHGVPAIKGEIDKALVPCMAIAMEELDPVELAVLRLSTWTRARSMWTRQSSS